MAFFLPLLLFSLFRNISCSSGTLEAKKNLMENLPLGWKHLTCSLLLLQQSQSYRFGFAPASPVQSFPSPSNPIMHTRKQFSCLQNWSGTGNNKSPTPDTCWQADCCGSKISELQTKPNWKDCKGGEQEPPTSEERLRETKSFLCHAIQFFKNVLFMNKNEK